MTIKLILFMLCFVCNWNNCTYSPENIKQRYAFGEI